MWLLVCVINHGVDVDLLLSRLMSPLARTIYINLYRRSHNELIDQVKLLALVWLEHRSQGKLVANCNYLDA